MKTTTTKTTTTKTMSDTEHAGPNVVALLGDVASILRLHIIGVAVAAAVVFGWLFTDVYHWDVALLGGVDWLLINLLNRVTDLKEDLANKIRGTERLVSTGRRVLGLWVGVFVGSFVVSHLLWPELTPWRCVVQLIGVGYSYRIVPTLSGWKRFKDLYFFKNFMSSVLFIHTVFLYPLIVSDWQLPYPGGWAGVALLCGFFVAFEITYEIMYDMRDLEGDRLANVPTYPVVHGVERSRQVIDGLLILSALAMGAGLISGTIGLREGLMLLAPLIQYLWFTPRFKRGLTTQDCIWLTHLGTALLLVFLLGTRLWVDAGLPENIWL